MLRTIAAALRRRPRADEAERPEVVPPVAVVVDLPVPPASDAPPTLSSVARTWVDGLPRNARPCQLADAFPRIANRLAICWEDVDLTEKVLDDLLVDKRGGRRGFPPEVTAELLRLHALSERRERRDGGAATLESTGAWFDHLQAPADR